MCKKLIYLTIFFALVLGSTSEQASGQWRAAYWDGNYPTAWAAENVTTEVRDYFEDAGYEILNADQLKIWMDARIADRTSSVVVFCRDIVPDTVAEENSADCTLRKYLDTGGKVVWYSDMPMYYQGFSNGTQTTWAEGGMANILDIPGTSWTNDTGSTVTITTEGADWGLTTTWTSNRWTPTDDTFTILATDSEGNAAAYAKHFVPGDTTAGFVRIWDFPVSAIPNFEDIHRVAEYGLGGNPYARGPSPADGAMHSEIWVTISWYAGSFAVSHDVYLGENFDDVNDATRDSDVFRINQGVGMEFYIAGFPPYAYPEGLVNGTTYYWRIDEVNDADPNSPWKGKVWSFTVPPKTAYDPIPADGTKFIDSEGPTLSWTAGFGSKLHFVYFGDDYDTVANASGAPPKAPVTHNPGTLEVEKTYYWRVDESDGVNTFTGEVWSFTTAKEGGGLKGEFFNNNSLTGAPVLTRVDPEIDFNWGNATTPGQNSPDESINVNNFSARWSGELEVDLTDAYTFEINANNGFRLWLDGQLIIDYWDNPTTSSRKSDPIELVGGTTYSIQMDYFEGEDTAIAQLYWASSTRERQIIPQAALSPPIKANSPFPVNGATGTKMSPILQWNPGDYAVSHEVYFGTEKDAVMNATAASPEYKGSKALGDESYDPGKLAWHTAYYWRIDEVNNVHPDSPWIGNVWSFTTGDFLLVDNFEAYDSSDNQIWFFWHDGLGYGTPGTPDFYGGNGTGAAVGDESTDSYTEETIVHSGRQAMPVSYDNNKQGFAKYSEVELILTDPRDWTEEGVAELSLWFRGYPGSVGSFVEGPVGTFTMTGSGADIWAVNGVEADEFHFAYKMLTGAGSIITRVDSVENTNGWAKAGVMIRETLDPDSAHAFACITPDNGVAAQGRPSTGGASFNTNEGGITAPHWVKLERSIAGTFTVSHSTNGSTWMSVTGASPQTIQMGANVYIGLALTSHDVGLTCQAVFSNVTTTGNVTGQWANQDIGILSNDAEPLYIAVSNSTGVPAIVVHDDPDASQIDEWTEWVIPLQDLADQGLVLTNVDKIAIGLGTRGNMTIPGGSGKMYFDDIRLYQPREVAE